MGLSTAPRKGAPVDSWADTINAWPACYQMLLGAALGIAAPILGALIGALIPVPKNPAA